MVEGILLFLTSDFKQVLNNGFFTILFYRRDYTDQPKLLWARSFGTTPV